MRYILKNGKEVEVKMQVWDDNWVDIDPVEIINNGEPYDEEKEAYYFKDSTFDSLKEYLEDWKNYETDEGLKEYKGDEWDEYMEEHPRIYKISEIK